MKIDSVSNDQQFYRVQLSANHEACTQCGHGSYYTIVYKDAGEDIEIGTAWGDSEIAEDICDLMNMAYDRGQEETDKLRGLINRVLEWEPAFPVESGLLDELAEAVKAPLTALRQSPDV